MILQKQIEKEFLTMHNSLSRLNMRATQVRAKRHITHTEYENLRNLVSKISHDLNTINSLFYFSSVTAPTTENQTQES